MTETYTSPTIELINRHGSLRHYKPDPIPREMIKVIVSAAQRAATSSNLQLYSVIAIQDPGKRAKLTELCGGQKHIREAPLFLTWCADLARLDRVCQIRGYTHLGEYVESFLTAVVDVTVAAQNATLAAQSLGLGCCYIGSLRNNPRQVIELLEIPKHVFPIYGMTIGWPVKPPMIRPRLPQEAILHWEKYNPDQDSALQEYDATMAATGIYNQRQVPVPGKPDQMEDYGWLEHTARRASRAMRTELRGILAEQGFPLK